MPERVLSDEEVRQLGLDQPKKERELSDAEVGALGLNETRVPSPTGWRRPGEKEPFFDRMTKADDKEREQMWSWLAAAAHGPAVAMEGPVAGLGAALKQDVSNIASGEPFNPTVKPADAYRAEKARVEGAQKENLERHPWAPLIGSVLTSPGSAPTLPGRLAMGAGQGGMYALGESPADLTHGEYGKAAKDVGKGVLIGTGGAAAGELLRLPGQFLAGRAQKLSDATHAAELAAEQEARAAEVASTRGSYGGEVSSGQRILEMVERASADPKADPATAAAAQQFLNSPEGTALLNQVLRSNVGRAGDAMGRIGRAQTAMTDAILKNDPALIRLTADAAAQAKLNDTSGVTSRLAELFRRTAPAAVGTALGGAPGAAAGALVSGVTGKPNVIVNNMLKSPSMYRPLIGGAAMSTGAGGAMSRAASPLAEYFDLLDEEPKP